LWPYAAAKVRAHALGWRCCNDDEGWLCPECYSEGWLCPECARRRKPARKTEGLRKALANLESEIARLEEES